MDSSYSIVFLATLLVLQPTISTNDVCKKVECGKGTCKSSSNSTFLFECECNPGWKQTRPDDDDDLKFLPCLVPNCTLNYSCTEAAPPVQDKESRSNNSIFDPCHWTDCGGGTCNKTSLFTHKCECSEGYYNLLNVTAFPCFRECALGMDCAKLGIGGMNKTSPSTPSLPENGKNQAISTTVGGINWLVVLTMCFVPFLGEIERVWNC